MSQSASPSTLSSATNPLPIPPARDDTPVCSPMEHPFPTGYVFSSPGCHFTYRVIGPCCPLFDREELPWPCCRIQWRGKEPSWRRIGRRFVADIAAKRCPSYAVELLNQDYSQEPFVLTLYWVKLPADRRDWWYSKVRATPEVGTTSEALVGES